MPVVMGSVLHGGRLPVGAPSSVSHSINEAGNTLRDLLGLHFLLCGDLNPSLNPSGLRGRILQIIPLLGSKMFNMAKAFSEVLFNFHFRVSYLFSVIHGPTSPGLASSWTCCLFSSSRP